MERIQVDPEALQALADTCNAIASQLEGLGRTVFEADEHVMGDPALANGLAEYHSSWSDRRSALIESLQEASQALDLIALNFGEADTELEGTLGST